MIIIFCEEDLTERRHKMSCQNYLKSNMTSSSSSPSSESSPSPSSSRTNSFPSHRRRSSIPLCLWMRSSLIVSTSTLVLLSLLINQSIGLSTGGGGGVSTASLRKASSYSLENRPLWPDPIFTSSSYYYADYKIPQVVTPPKNKFLPEPPNCPETGRTVCQDVMEYPS